MNILVSYLTFYNQSIHSSRGHFKLNLEVMNAVLVTLKITTSVGIRIVRPLMLRYIYHKQSLDARFIRKFRNRVELYHAWNSQYNDLSMEHVQLIVSRKDVATKEYNVLRNPVTR